MNIIANEQSNPIKTKLSNDNDNKWLYADKLADKLCEMFKSPETSRGFYYKYALLLGSTTVERLAGKALVEGSNPGALFNWLARREVERRNA